MWAEVEAVLLLEVNRERGWADQDAKAASWHVPVRRLIWQSELRCGWKLDRRLQRRRQEVSVKQRARK